MSDQEQKKQRIIRSKPDTEYFSLPNAAAQNIDIPYDALGVLTYLLSKPVDWETTVFDLRRRGDGKGKIYRILQNLEQAGYMSKPAKYQDAKTKRWVWTPRKVADTPQFSNPCPTKPDTAHPDTANEEIKEQRTDEKGQITKKDSVAPKTGDAVTADNGIELGSDGRLTDESWRHIDATPPDSAWLEEHALDGDGSGWQNAIDTAQSIADSCCNFNDGECPVYVDNKLSCLECEFANDSTMQKSDNANEPKKMTVTELDNTIYGTRDEPVKADAQLPIGDDGSGDGDLVDEPIPPPEQAETSAKKPPTPHTLMKNALVTAMGYQQDDITTWGEYNKASKMLRDGGATPDDMMGLYNFTAKAQLKGGWEFKSPVAMATRWPEYQKQLRTQAQPEKDAEFTFEEE